MNGKLKVLAVSLAAVFAIAGAPAPAAIASGELFHSHAEPTVLTGSNAGLGTLTFTTEEGVPMECETAVVAGTQSGKTAEEVTVQTTVTGCALGGVPITVSSAGCHYILLSETTEDPHTGLQAGAAEIACGEGHSFYFEGAKCKITLETPQVVHGLSYTNEGTFNTASEGNPIKDVRVAAQVSTLKYIAENTAGIGFKCGTLGIELGTHDAALEGEVKVKGYVDNGDVSEHEYEEGAQVGIWWQ